MDVVKKMACGIRYSLGESLKSLTKISRNYSNSTDGNFSIIGAISIIPIIGALSLAVDLGNMNSVRVKNQSVADSIALGAALYYSSKDDESVMTEVVNDMFLAANLVNSTVAVSIVPSPQNSDNEAVKVSISTESPVVLGGVVGAADYINVTVDSFVEFPGNPSPNCVISLSGDIEVGSYAQMNATDCGAGAQGNLEATSGSRVNVSSINVGGVSSASSSAIISTSPESNNINENLSNPVADPFAGSAELATELDKIGDAAAPAVPTVPIGTDFVVPYGGTSFNFQGYNVTKSGGTWYAPAGTYNIRNLNLSVSKLLVFQSPSILNFSGNINIGTSSMLTINDSDVYSTGTLEAQSSGGISIGNGRFYFRRIVTGSSGFITIGDGDIDVSEVVAVGSSSSLTIGDGDKRFGSIDVGSSGILMLGDGGLNVDGNVEVGSSARLTTGTTPETYINGNLNTASYAELNLGASRYFIDGDFGGSSGGRYNGTDVSIFTSGDIRVGSSSGSRLSAPSNDGDATVDTLVFASRTANTVDFSSSGTVTIIGTLYTPNSRINLSSSGQVTGAGECTLIIADSIVMSSSAELTTKCDSLSDAFNPPSSAAKIALVQ